jgi:hypothetical protein
LGGAGGAEENGSGEDMKASHGQDCSTILPEGGVLRADDARSLAASVVTKAALRRGSVLLEHPYGA